MIEVFLYAFVAFGLGAILLEVVFSSIIGILVLIIWIYEERKAILYGILFIICIVAVFKR